MDISTLFQALSLSHEIALFGNTLYQYFMLFVTVFVFIILSKVVYYLFKNYARRITEKTKTYLDDLLVGIVELPLTMLVIVLGVYLGNVVFLTEGTYIYAVLNNTVKILIIIDVAWLTLRILDALLIHYIKPYIEKSESRLDDQILPILRKSIQIVVILVTLIFILSNFGYDVTALIAGLGIGGIAVALAAQDTISNFIGSLIIFTSKPFKVGDAVKFGDFAGIVREVSLRTTKFETFYGTRLIVPNNKLSTDILENLSEVTKRRIDLNIGLTYDTNYQKLSRAMKILEKILAAHPNISEYDVKFVEFGPYSLNISVWYWIKDLNEYRNTTNEVNLEIKKAFDKEGIDMAFPTQTLYVKQ